MTLIIFDEVKIRAKKRMKCADGKTRSRAATFTNTINPFNKNPDGTVRNHTEVYACVKAEAEAWKKQPITDY